MERMRERQIADLNNPLKDLIGTTRMRNVWGTLTMKDGRSYDVDDYRIEGESVRFIRSYGDHPIRIVPFRDVEELKERKWQQTGRERKF